MTYAIETRQLTKASGHRVRVSHLDLQVPEGCVYGFLGPNGAGKSTTLKLLLGLIRPTGGEIRLFGEKMTQGNRLRLLRSTGSLIEGPSFYGGLTGQENMEIIAKYKGAKEAQVEALLKAVRLYEAKDQKVKQYSLGMKQRLAIAMALLGRPKILILDEPTNGLDPAGIAEMRQFIKELPRQFQMTVLVSSHLLNEVQQMADFVGIIHQGELRYQGPLSGLETGGRNLEQVFLQLTGEEQA